MSSSRERQCTGAPDWGGKERKNKKTKTTARRSTPPHRLLSARLCQAVSLSNNLLDPEQDVGLPVVELGDLVELDDVRGEGFDVAVVDCVGDSGEELGFAGGGKGDV